jgi:hypothetical protein
MSPWHKISFDRFLEERLPQLLASRLPLAGYRIDTTGTYTCRVEVALGGAEGRVEVVYAEVPRPDEEGTFAMDGRRLVVVPRASEANLEAAEIRCAGEQLYDWIAARLGEAPEGLPWDEGLARTWLPLDLWVRAFLRQVGQPLQETNWLARRTHLRRISVPRGEEVIAPEQFGRTCPIETPEGPNLGHVLSVAVGAEIRQGKLIVTDPRPEATLGLTASMIPFLEHSSMPRLSMGANMMRQWLAPPDPEPALVRTGSEPEHPELWCGRNLLTAYISWGVDTFEDAIVISESCASRLGYPQPIEPGDKLSNRHGTKGIVSRILPDDQMPHLADGTPVELVFSFIGLYTRMNLAQLREAVMSRIARAESAPAIVPPFHAPREPELRERLRNAGLPDDGMETLTWGRDGEELPQRSAVGWVYWGRLVHVARARTRATVDGTHGQRLTDADFAELRDVGAFETMRDLLGTGQPGISSSPRLFMELTRRLAVAGICVERDGDRLTFRFAPIDADGPPEGVSLRLATAVPHPWSPERSLAEIGELPECPEYRALVRANTQLEHLRAGQAPPALTQRAVAALETQVRRFLGALLRPEHLRLGARARASGRAVIAPAADLRLDQIGIADEIAWTLFGPWVAREIGDEPSVLTRDAPALQVLDEIMARSWVIVYHRLFSATRAFLAFHPVRSPDRLVRLHPLVCRALNADFDGDDAAVLLPNTEAAQREAGERLSVAGRLTRDPDWLRELLPVDESMWGLASLSLTPSGRAEIAGAAGLDVAAPAGFITHESLYAALRRRLERGEIEKTLDALQQLARRGFEVARESGASVSPFFGASVPKPLEPESEDADLWDACAQVLADRIAARTDFQNDDLGPALLAVKCGARGRLRHLSMLAGTRGTVTGSRGEPVVIRHGYCDGLTCEELFAEVALSRSSLARFHLDEKQVREELRRDRAPRGWGILARAMRSARPGLVFANAAATGEVDPLTDVESRLFVGLPG